MKQGFAMIFWRFPKPSHFTESCANCHIQKNTLKRIKTRLTYNCAHLRSTKESLTILVKIFWVKIFLSENFLGEFFLVKIFWGEIFFGENLSGENFFG